ncbi:DUF2484 family protein [Oceaniglobus roseus]|uniref:DUF2484 family protein n=1 Tax=Oceaniglobus roseus TaxID=1737570 RepID=UPI000C7EC520|nr:DUF2484 family protein [Kandeliimicrobium roseum]
MSLSLTLACLWFLVANIGAILPSRRSHWPLAWALIAVGIPLLGLATWQHGPWIGMLLLVGGASVLRWPLLYLGRWIRRRGGLS